MRSGLVLLALGGVLALAACSSAPPRPAVKAHRPAATGVTNNATHVTDTSAVLHGAASCVARPCTAWFQWSTNNFASWKSGRRYTERAAKFTIAALARGLKADRSYQIRLAVSDRRAGRAHYWDGLGGDHGDEWTFFTTTGGPKTRPFAQSTPTITGTPRRGQVLTAAHGYWGGAKPIRFAYQWQSCRTSSDCSNIRGATHKSYRVRALGGYVQVVVTATNRRGSTKDQSNSLGPVK